MPILTQRPRIPWSWAFFMGFPWMANIFAERASAEPITFTLREFTADPAVISLILSINVLFNFLVGVTACYVSDRIWTRVGRRRPFLIVGFAGAAVSLACVPLMETLWGVIAAIVVFQFFVDFSKPWEALFNEVVPPKQRGRAGMFRMLQQNAGNLVFSTVLIAQYDNTYDFTVFGMPLTGDKVAFWGCSLMLLLASVMMIFFVREERPEASPGVHPAKPRAKISWKQGLRSILKDIFGERQALWVYLLYLCPVLSGSAVSGAMLVLFQTEQLGYTKAQLGQIFMYVLPVQMVLWTPLAGFLADKISRLWMMRLGIIIPALLWFGLTVYAEWVVDFQVALPIMIGTAIAISFFQTWLWVVWGPLIFDYVPSNRMGTYMAGFTSVAGITGFALTNVGGLWVKGFSTLFRHDGPAPYNYASIGFAMVGLATLAVAGTFAFSWAENKGQVRPLGRLEKEEDEPTMRG